MIRTLLATCALSFAANAAASPLPQIVTPVLNTLALPVLGGMSGLQATGPIGLTILEEGDNGSGIGQVLALHPIGTLIDDQLDGLGTPLIGLDGDGGLADIGVFNGDDTANAGPAGLLGACVSCGDINGNGGLLGIAALSGSQVANGSLVGLGVLNENHSGHGGLLGVAALSGTNSGRSSEGLGIGILNAGETLRIDFGGQTRFSLAGAKNSIAGALGEIDLLPGINIGGVSRNPNALLNVGVLGGDHAGTGGLIGLAVLSGDHAGQGDLAGVCVLCGDNSGTASAGLGLAVLSGDAAGTGGLLGAGVLVGDNSAQGGLLGAGVLIGDNAGQGGLLGAGALSGDNSGSGDVLGAGVITGDNSGAGGVIGAGVIGGDESGSGMIGAGALNGNPVAAGNGGDSNGDAALADGGLADPFRSMQAQGAQSAAAADAGQLCTIAVKNVAGEVTQVVKTACVKRPTQSRV